MRALIAVVFLLPVYVLASPFSECMATCQASGGNLGQCHGRCGGLSQTNPGDLTIPRQQSRQPRTDRQCMNDCADNGNSFGYCRSRCSY